MNFNFFKLLFASDDSAATHTLNAPMTAINPSTGLPMIDSGLGGVDVGGSPFGTDIHSSISDDFTSSVDWSSWD